jgi:hypothetical protein
MGAICLVAAFAFGNYINWQPPVAEQNQTVDSVGDGVQSLIEPDLLVEKRPAKTPWVKPKLTARLPMPSLPEDQDVDGQRQFSIDDSRFENSPILNSDRSNDNEIPPPSDLTGRVNVAVKTTSNKPTVIIEDAPDFSGGLNVASSMPVVSDRKRTESPNLADQFRSSTEAYDQASDSPVIEHSPVFINQPEALAENNTDRKWSKPLVATSAESTLQSNANGRGSGGLAPINFGRPEVFVSAPRSMRSESEVAWSDQEKVNGQSVLEPNQSSGLVPLPNLQANSNSTASDSIEIRDPGAAFGAEVVRAEPSTPAGANLSEASIGNQNSAWSQREPNRKFVSENNQHRVARLPFQLNSNAKTRLTKLRDQAIEKISLETTRFTDHVVENGESLQAIATRFFGKPDFYLDIYMANRDQLRFPGDIRAGMVIKVPVYQ